MELIRGDTFAFRFKILSKDNQVIPEEDIKELYITFKKNANLEQILFQKKLSEVTFTDEYYHVIFKPEDTEKLPYGDYVFDIEVTTNNEVRKTKVCEIKLTEEVTHHKGGEVIGN